VTRREFSTAWILLAVVVGGVLGIFVPFTFPGLEIITWVALALMVFSVVSALPLLSLGKAVAKPRVVVALFAVNLVVVPVVAFILSRVLWQHPALQVGLLLVLLAPGVALSLTTVKQAGGDVESVLGVKPLLLVGQLIVVPVYAVALSGGVLGFDDFPATFAAVMGAIVVPGVLALLFQLLGQRTVGLAQARQRFTRYPVVFIAVAVIFVLWSRVPDHSAELMELLRLVPLFFAFLVLLAPLGLLAGILASLTPSERRAIMIVGAGRGGVIMLPITMALEPEMWGVIPLVVVVHLVIEILGMMVYRTIVPEIVPLDGP
jgi:ACR3 family arsenite efflux pump ArsB